jgi:hypothetical protein
VSPLSGDAKPAQSADLVRDFDDWLRYGQQRGWISSPVCATHIGLPNTDDEEAAWEAGEDPCQHALRLWEQDW